jgi:hypothetical protein
MWRGRLWKRAPDRPDYFSFAYSALVSFRIAMLASTTVRAETESSICAYAACSALSGTLIPMEIAQLLPFGMTSTGIWLSFAKIRPRRRKGHQS